MPESEKVENISNINDPLRHQWISVSAYFKSEALDFDPKNTLDNWLTAENEYTELQIQSFIVRSQEDGEITIYSLQELAKSVGIQNPEELTTKIALIREIQNNSHHTPCFQSIDQDQCTDKETECPWSKECHRLVALWYR